MYGCTVPPVAARSCSSSLLSSACTVLIAPITEESSTVASASPFFTVSPALTRIFSSFTPLGRTICCVSASVSMPEPETVVLMLPVVTVASLTVGAFMLPTASLTFFFAARTPKKMASASTTTIDTVTMMRRRFLRCFSRRIEANSAWSRSPDCSGADVTFFSSIRLVSYRPLIFPDSIFIRRTKTGFGSVMPVTIW